MPPTLATADHLLAAMLRGPATWPKALGESESAELIERAFYHGIVPLLFQKLHGQPEWQDWPEKPRNRLEHAARIQAALELGRQRDTAQALNALGAAGIRPIVLKGGGLAYRLYEQPWMRPRADADVLVPTALRDEAQAVLAALEFERARDAGGELVRTQASFSHDTGDGVVTAIDLHWELNNSPPLSSALSYDSLRTHALAVPALGSFALTPDDADALLLACLHRAGHTNSPYTSGGKTYYGGNRLIWLYDIHLLAQRLDDDGWTRVVEAARTQRVSRICVDALEVTQYLLATAVPDQPLRALRLGAAHPEPSAALLTGNRWRIMKAEMEVLDWPGRLRYLREHVLPPGDYMLLKYGTRRRWLLPALYVRRALGWLVR